MPEAETRQRKNGLRSKIHLILSNASVEPSFFLTLLTSMMYQLITQTLYLEKACRVDIQFNDSICNALSVRNTSGYSDSEEVTVQKLVSQMLGLRMGLQGTVPPLLLLFFGSWSDRHNRRKPLILIPIIGEIFSCLFLILNVIFFYQLSIVYTTLSDILPISFLGGWPCIFLGVYSYVGANSSEENRTIRIGIVSAAQMTSQILAMSICGIILKATGFIGFYSISIFLLIVSFLLGFIMVREPKPENTNRNNLFEDFFNLHHFTNTIKVCFRRGKNKRRKKISIIMILSMIILGTWQGEFFLNYLYTSYRYGWNVIQYGVFSSSIFLLQSCGVFISLLFSKLFKWKDETLGIIALLGAMSASLTYALAPVASIFFVGGVCDIFYIAAHISLRSIMSKIVPKNELGQSNSVFGVIEALMPLIFGPLYTMIYKVTIDTIPGTYHLVSAFLKFIGVCFFTMLYMESAKDKIEDEDWNEITVD